MLDLTKTILYQLTNEYIFLLHDDNLIVKNQNDDLFAFHHFKIFSDNNEKIPILISPFSSVKDKIREEYYRLCLNLKK